MSDTHRNSDQYMLRLPDGLRRELKTAAKANGRSMNAEIIARIQDDHHSLRDWFAGQALAGMMAQSHTGPKDWTHMGHGWGEDCVNSLNKHETHVSMSLASFAYEQADAMLAERSKP